MKNRHLLILGIVLALSGTAIGYAAWRVWPPLLLTASCEADRCDPMIGFLAGFDNHDVAVLGIDMLVTLAGDEDTSAEATGRAWLELARYYEKNRKLTADYFPDMEIADYYENAAVFGNQDAIEWQRANSGAPLHFEKRWGETHDNWSAALTMDQGEATCFITSEDVQTAGGDTDRYPNLIFFFRVSNADHLQMQYNRDTTDLAGSGPKIQFDGDPELVSGRLSDDGPEYLLFGDGEPELLHRAMAGSRAKIIMTDADGNSIADTVDLAGLAEAHADMERVCNIGNAVPNVEAKTD